MTTAWGLLALDLLGVFVFALSGGLVAVRKRFDLLAVLILATAAGLGGGILRDVLIGAVPPVGLSDWRLVAAACAAGSITFFFHPRVSRTQSAVLLLDAAGLGLFAVAGTLKALEAGTTGLTAVIVGVLTGVGGGVLRDLLAGDQPRLLAEREWYATPALIGASVYAVAWSADLAGPPVAAGCVVLITALRVLGLTRRWQVPAPRDAD
ncbi:MAG: hypothetical protein JWN88_680 [Frankiales bacterium]|jgi:uncharacterized membrane protein YeiH|nr:hypothetical protein [Frankiales bacterium]